MTVRMINTSLPNTSSSSKQKKAGDLYMLFDVLKEAEVFREPS